MYVCTYMYVCTLYVCNTWVTIHRLYKRKYDLPVHFVPLTSMDLKSRWGLRLKRFMFPVNSEVGSLEQFNTERLPTVYVLQIHAAAPCARRHVTVGGAQIGAPSSDRTLVLPGIIHVLQTAPLGQTFTGRLNHAVLDAKIRAPSQLASVRSHINQPSYTYRKQMLWRSLVFENFELCVTDHLSAVACQYLT